MRTTVFQDHERHQRTKLMSRSLIKALRAIRDARAYSYTLSLKPTRRATYLHAQTLCLSNASKARTIGEYANAAEWTSAATYLQRREHACYLDECDRQEIEPVR